MKLGDDVGSQLPGDACSPTPERLLRGLDRDLAVSADAVWDRHLHRVEGGIS
jgi:hypothetical protein